MSDDGRRGTGASADSYGRSTEKPRADIPTEKDFANPRAPQHISAPRFAVPKKHSSVAGAHRNLVAMTPRSVLSSQRAFSSVVMTPRADGVAAVAETGIRLNPSSTAKVTKGAKQSAPDRPIFSPDASYVDRAAARRAAERGESDNLAAILDATTAHSTTRVASAEVQKDAAAADGRPACRSEMAQRLGEIVGVLPNRVSKDGDHHYSIAERPPALVERFLPGRMLYAFHLDDDDYYNSTSSSPPSTIMLARRATSQETKTSLDAAHLPADLLRMMVNALVPKMEGGDAVSRRVDANDGLDEDDIFPDAGDEYIPSEGAVAEGLDHRRGASMERPVVFKGITTPTTLTMPESIRRLADEGKLRTKSVDQASSVHLPDSDDYAECYPGVYESVSALVDDEDDVAGHRPSAPTKRQLAAKERQKLDRQMSKVTKILESRKRDAGGGGQPSSLAD